MRSGGAPFVDRGVRMGKLEAKALADIKQEIRQSGLLTARFKANAKSMVEHGLNNIGPVTSPISSSENPAAWKTGFQKLLPQMRVSSGHCDVAQLGHSKGLPKEFKGL